MRIVDRNHAQSLEAIVLSRECVVATAASDVAGDDAAAMFFSDHAVLAENATVSITTPAAWAGAVWRLGSSALKLLSSTTVSASDAVEIGLCDERVDLSGRSPAALDSAAMLIARRGGDALERAEFARLFAAGVPQEGLAAFLEKRKPRFEQE